jgi:hypothetical protein
MKCGRPIRRHCLSSCSSVKGRSFTPILTAPAQGASVAASGLIWREIVPCVPFGLLVITTNYRIADGLHGSSEFLDSTARSLVNMTVWLLISWSSWTNVMLANGHSRPMQLTGPSSCLRFSRCTRRRDPVGCSAQIIRRHIFDIAHKQLIMLVR